MNKAVVVIMVLLLAASLSAFANGTGETTGNAWSWGLGPTYSGKSITLTGTLDLQPTNTFPVLKTGSEEWALMVPNMYGTGITVKTGDTVTVSGFEVPGSLWNGGSSARYLMVQRAVIAGKEYLLPGYGPGYGRGWGYGPGYGMMGWAGGRWGYGRGCPGWGCGW